MGRGRARSEVPDPLLGLEKLNCTFAAMIWPACIGIGQRSCPVPPQAPGWPKSYSVKSYSWVAVALHVLGENVASP